MGKTERKDGYYWVKASVRLPEINHIILAFTSKGRKIIAWIDAGTKEFDDQDLANDEFITHWRLLPKGPRIPEYKPKKRKK